VAYRQIAFLDFPPDRTAFIAKCGDDYGRFDLLESYIHSKSGEISLAPQDRQADLDMLDRILSKLVMADPDPKDHTYRYVSAIRKLVSLV
jgi:hypothetical protein